MSNTTGAFPEWFARLWKRLDRPGRRMLVLVVAGLADGWLQGDMEEWLTANPGPTVADTLAWIEDRARVAGVDLTTVGCEPIGVAELAALLGVGKQRASQLARSRRFPRTIATLACGPVWDAAEVRAFIERWDRRTGRPRRDETP